MSSAARTWPSVALAAGLALAAALGVVGRSEVYARPDLRRAFLANDLVVLAFVVPLLLVVTWAAHRGSWSSRLARPGGAWLVLYVASPYVLALPRGATWLLHLALFAAAGYLAAADVASIDAPAVKRRLDGAVPARAIGAVTACLGAAFLAFATGSLLVAALRGGAEGPEAAVFAGDLLASPAWIVGGVALFRRTAFGYAVALGLLVQLAAAFAAVVLVVAVAPLVTGAPLATADLMVLTGLSLFAVVPLVAFLRGAARRSVPPS